MRLVFIRHGEAVEIGEAPGRRDSERALTERGRRRLRAGLPRLAGYLAERRLQIWSSPLLRAVQTADILRECLVAARGSDPDDLRTIRYNFIATGDESALLRELKALPTDETDQTVVVVGHEPTLSLWAERLGGLPVVMRKGSVAEIRLSEDLGGGERIWFAPLSDMDHLPLLLLQQPQSTVEHRLEDFLARPDQPENVHQLRVALRRLRSLISFLKPLLRSDSIDAIQDEYRRLAADCGPLREWDVLIEGWNTLLAASGKAPEESPLLDLLNCRRKAEVTRTHARIAEAAEAGAFAHLYQRIFSSIREDRLRRRTAGQFINRRLAAWSDTWTLARAAVDWTNYTSIHQLRIKSKKLRYVGELFDDILTIDERTTVQELKKLQTILGAICDGHRNEAALGELLAETPNPTAQLIEEVRVYQEEARRLQDSIAPFEL